MRDIFNEIAERDAKPAKQPKKKRPVYCVSLGNGRISRRMSAKKASKLAERFNRVFGTDIAYVTT